MNLRKIQEKKKGISPIIATLLLILIAIAAGVIVYAYVIGFIGNSTSNPGGAQSVLSIENSCVTSTTGHCGVALQYVVLTLLNQGTTSFPSTGSINVYMTDVTSGTAVTYTCTSSSTAPGNTLQCNDPASTGYSAGDTITMKVVMPDGGSATSSVKAIG